MKGQQKMLSLLLLLCWIHIAVAWEWPWITDEIILIDAAKNGEVDRLEALVARTMSLDLNQHHQGGITALIAAAYKNRTSTVQFLVDAGADPDGGALNGWTPLMAASTKGFVAIGQILIEAGANPNAATRTTKLTSLILAAQNGHADFIELLLGLSVDVNAITTDGKTAFSLATAGGFDAALQVLQRSKVSQQRVKDPKESADESALADELDGVRIEL
jgi:ankyrin repeat protein